ncbi:hypothetical protein [Fictibacillus enclensis]|uniref:hypothetical protein n=1 Tax=Fictibacillus enclensis TaxID=1017270 RepID=UPI0024BFAA8C|nr:hypothetical protein [Fictibacillus enclensis]WHY71251.1 hypothetical protein QNH15_19895 [Fictibacillus enclensis]
MENEKSVLSMGALCKAKLEFKHVETGESVQSSPRPVLVLRDLEDGAVQIATLTSRIEKRHVAEIGHILEDSLEYGLIKKSAVLCSPYNIGYLSRENLSEPFGKVPLTEMVKVFDKVEQVNKKEHNLHMKLVSEHER